MYAITRAEEILFRLSGSMGCIVTIFKDRPLLKKLKKSRREKFWIIFYT